MEYAYPTSCGTCASCNVEDATPECLLNPNVAINCDYRPEGCPFNNGWIPVMDHLPELNEKVLVTAYGRVCYAQMISVDGNDGYPVFKLQDSLNEKTVLETISHGEYSKGRIDAWMKLPNPYKIND